MSHKAIAIAIAALFVIGAGTGLWIFRSTNEGPSAWCERTLQDLNERSTNEDGTPKTLNPRDWSLYMKDYDEYLDRCIPQ